MNTPPFENEHQGAREAASILLLRVALVLLGEARVRGDFGEEAALGERAANLAAEFNGGAPSPDPQGPPVEAGLIRPDRISLSAPFREGGAVVENLTLTGILVDGASVSVSRLVRREALSPEERAEQECRQRFTATRFVRSVAAPRQPGAAVPILAVALFGDGLYVEYTYDTEPPTPDLETTVAQRFARAKGPEIAVEDDLGTAYFQSGLEGGGGLGVSHSSRGFTPAPPPDARVLRITVGGETVALDLEP